MAERVELKVEDMDKVVGGAFNFFEDENGYQCYVDDVGLYHAKYSAKRAITLLYLKNKDKTPEELVEMAIADGELW